ncbi:ABC transporter permease [Streptomyces sp. NPDC000878]
MIRFERRPDSPRRPAASVPPAVALTASAVLVGCVLLATGHDPIHTYRSMIQAAFTDPGAFSATLLNATPLLFTGLCAAVAFRMRLYNIGGEGQLYMGAVAAAGAGLALGGRPGPLILAGTITAGVLGGALWAAIPGVLRACLNANEILTSLMLNYVSGLLAYYLIFDSRSYWRDVTSTSASVFPQGKTIDTAGWWPQVTLGGTVLPLGLLVGLGAAIALFGTLRWTRFGFQLRVISDSPEAGRYAGLRTTRTIVVVMLLSGAFAGFAGASQVGDFSHTLDPQGLQDASLGYTGIAVAALGRFNPVAVIGSSLLFGALTNAGFKLQGSAFPQGLVGITQGIVLFCLLSAELLARYRIRRRRPADSSDPEPGTAQSASPELPAESQKQNPDIRPLPEPTAKP